MESRPTEEQDFLAELGRRVRHVRALRGMSRKVLARVSGISERYIAQLESGKGNVSIKLLRRVSGAMGTRIEDLIIDPTVPPDRSRAGSRQRPHPSGGPARGTPRTSRPKNNKVARPGAAGEG